MVRLAKMKVSALLRVRPLTRSGLMLALLLGLGVARGDDPDPSPYLGSWVFGPASRTSIDCGSVGTLPSSLAGSRPAVYAAPPGSGSDLVFDIGCHCRIALSLTPTGAATTTPQPCQLVNDAVPMSGQIDSLTLTLTAPGELAFELHGENANLTAGRISCSAATFSGSGTITRVGPDVVTCGDDATAVGVPAYFPDGNGTCMMGAGREGLQIQMHDEDSPACSDETGSGGEGTWLLPDDDRERHRNCSGHVSRTALNFCRVDGARFGALVGASDPAQSYAVLKLGTRCPAGAVEVSKTIDNEDEPGDAPSLVLGDPGPNTVVADPSVGTVTTLVFCYFRGADAPAPSMTGFPDLGFPYSVFHRYGGVQPSWVIAKRWQWSDDENGQHAGQYGKDAYQGDDDAVASFQDIIENPQNDTIFNIARVR